MPRTPRIPAASERRESARHRRARRRATADGGAVTAELALALPALIAVLGLCLWVISAAGAAMSAADAARAGARAAARGESPAAVAALVRAVGPRGAQVSTVIADGLVTVTVRARVGPPAGAIPGPGLVVSGRAVAALERPAEQPADVHAGPPDASGDPPAGPADAGGSTPEAP